MELPNASMHTGISKLLAIPLWETNFLTRFQYSCSFSVISFTILSQNFVGSMSIVWKYTRPFLKKIAALGEKEFR